MRSKSLAAVLPLIGAAYIFACCCLNLEAQTRRAVVLTTDVGAEMDDQWTLAHLALAPEIELRGVVTAHAPSLPAPAAETAARVAREVMRNLPVRRPPPVVAGSSVPLERTGAARRNAGVELIIRESREFSPERRLAVLVIGAATDVASALLLDPTLGERVEVIAMGFDDLIEGGDSWNVKNDPQAWRVILASSAPIIIGDAKVTKRDLAMTRRRADELFARRGAAGRYLVKELAKWLDRDPKFCREVAGAPDTWIIWDQVATAHLLGLTQTVKRPRPALGDDLRFTPAAPAAAKPNIEKPDVEWVVKIDGAGLWRHFAERLPAANKAAR